MMIPLLPESAPFTPAQRAWLNGFFAGLLGLDAGANGSGNGNGNAYGYASVNGVANGMASVAANGTATSDVATAVAVAEDEEEFPWHDPSLPIDERLKLAEDRPLPRKLMAAMAQLDCGACGYLCQTYSEAIASGEEKSLTKCTPGGKETSRKLKALIAASGAATTSGTSMTSVVAGDGHGNGVATITTSGATM